ncbi:GatB/Yqey family protein [Candidatus Vecturithrix granuli]|uniref:GatB/Yqey family protein n=1 Tax=Vecturithrix granuli TaxID=1499967 RepID=A0A081BYF2_VECG1|nr:GatB/Yqey family protein [Candidatus Vecturithrix granuli]
MSLKEQLTQDMKTAMKQKEQIRLSIIRLVRSAIKNREIELGKDLEDDDVLKVMATLVKQHKDSIEQFEKGGRTDLVEKEQAELDILETYLPKQLTEAELSALIQEAIREVGATSAKEMGKVMKALMPKIQGRADGKLVSQLVKDQLV